MDLTEGDYWQFLTRDGQLLVIGFDGCNGFGSSSSRDGAPTALQDGRLVNLGVASQAMACDGVEYGPYPEEGDLLTLTTDGSRLDVSDASGTRIELIRLDETPVRRLGETPTSGASDTAAPITDPPQRDEPFWAVPTEIVETTVPCSGERVSDSFDYVEGHRGAATIEDAVDGWNFDGGATYRGAELFAVVDADAGRAALVDGDGNLRVLLTVRENENGWLVESSERCLDP